MLESKMSLMRKRELEMEKNPERRYKLQQCCDMLLAGGYFRVRIPTLSAFDKVVGGIAWSIANCGEAVGVDILFQENSTIGQRIKLCEVLVKTLLAMNCTDTLQEVHIQGLDYDTLMPLIRVLVQKVLAHRERTGNMSRLLSESQFDKRYEFFEEKLSTKSEDYMMDVVEQYKPVRQFRKQNTAVFKTIESQTEATLLEYGEQLFGMVFEDEEKEDRKKERQARRGGVGKMSASKIAAVGKIAGLEPKEEKEKSKEEAKQKSIAKEKKRLEDMKEQMSATSQGKESKVSGQSVGKIVTLQADQLRQAAEEFAEEMKKAGSEDSAAAAQKSAEQAHQRQIEAFVRKINAAKKAIEKKKPAFKALSEKDAQLKATLGKRQAYAERIVTESKKLDVESSTDNSGKLEQLKALVLLNENLKMQETQFKENCKQQRADLLNMLKSLESDESDEETKKMLEIEKIFNSDTSKLQKLRQVLASKNQEIAKINRMIDEIPTRAELLQFERRFVELYELVQDKLVETRKYYNLYNTLNEKYGFMENEVKLLDSIIEGFPTAMKTKGGQAKFLESFDGIINGIEQNKQYHQREKENETTTRDVLSQKQTKMQEKQRKYFKAVKEFQEECFKNEKYAETLENLE